MEHVRSDTGRVMLTATACGLISGMSPNDMAKHFINGAKSVIGVCVIIGFATGINIILTDGNILHTIVHALSSLFVNSSQLCICDWNVYL